MKFTITDLAKRIKLISIRIVSVPISYIIFFINCLVWKKPARPNKIILVPQNRITRTIEFSRIVRQKRYYLNGIILKGRWGRTGNSIYELHESLFDAFRLRFHGKIPFEKTEYFQKRYGDPNLLKKQADYYENKYSKLFNAIQNHGFEIPDSISSPIDEFKVSIASNGDFLFMTGKHRLAIAKLMGKNFKIPAKISHRHYEWQKYRDKLYNDYISGKITESEIRKLDHPDLFDLIE